MTNPNDGKNVMFFSQKKQFVIQTPCFFAEKAICHSHFRICGMSAILMADEASSASSDKYEIS